MKFIIFWLNVYKKITFIFLCIIKITSEYLTSFTFILFTSVLDPEPWIWNESPFKILSEHGCWFSPQLACQFTAICAFFHITSLFIKLCSIIPKEGKKASSSVVFSNIIMLLFASLVSSPLCRPFLLRLRIFYLPLLALALSVSGAAFSRHWLSVFTSTVLALCPVNRVEDKEAEDFTLFVDKTSFETQNELSFDSWLLEDCGVSLS